MSRILVTGHNSGLGASLFRALAEQGHDVYGASLENGVDVRDPKSSDAWNYIMAKAGGLDVLINCAGINRIGWLEDFPESDWDEVMDTNAKGIYMMSRYFLSMLAESKGTIINIVSNAAHVPMTCSLAYNASKGAAHIMTLQLARELTKKHGITVFGIAPNRLAGTAMSDYIDRRVVEARGWTKSYAREYQRNALLAGAETPPERVAEFIAFLLEDKERHRYLTGTVIPYGA